MRIMDAIVTNIHIELDPKLVCNLVSVLRFNGDVKRV